VGFPGGQGTGISSAPVSWTLHCSYDGTDPVRSPGMLCLEDDEEGRWSVRDGPDPVIWVSASLLRELHQGCPEFVALDCGRRPMELWADNVLVGTSSSGPSFSFTGGRPFLMPAPCRFTGDILRFHGGNWQHVYVVRGRIRDDPEIWEVSWPD
jgi:hypothetical protein